MSSYALQSSRINLQTELSLTPKLQVKPRAADSRLAKLQPPRRAGKTGALPCGRFARIIGAAFFLEAIKIDMRRAFMKMTKYFPEGHMTVKQNKQTAQSRQRKDSGAKKKGTCIVLEGGGMRCAFTAGVLDYLLDNGFFFDHLIGVSGGACAGASYIAKQKRRNYAAHVVYPQAPEYMGMKQQFTKGSYFNMDFIFRKVPDEINLFDYKTALANPAKFDMIVTSQETGKAEALGKDGIDAKSFMQRLIATSSIPLLAKPVNVDGKMYYDGGVADSIPIAYALSMYSKVVVVATRPRGYRKEPPRSKWLMKLLFCRHKALGEAMINRSANYNASLKLCEEAEADGRAFVISPDAKYKISRTEKDIIMRDMVYRHGYALMEDKFAAMKKFLGGK